MAINRRTLRYTAGATGGIAASHLAGQWAGRQFGIRQQTGRGAVGGALVGIPSLIVADNMGSGRDRDMVRQAGYASLGYAAANVIFDAFGIGQARTPR